MKGLEEGDVTTTNGVSEFILVSGDVNDCHLNGMCLQGEAPRPDQFHEGRDWGIKLVKQVTCDHVIYMEDDF